MRIDNAREAAVYGNLARVAMNFHISTGNPAELQAAVCYANAAAYWANRAVDGIEWTAPTSTCIESIGDEQPIRLSSQILVF